MTGSAPPPSLGSSHAAGARKAIEIEALTGPSIDERPIEIVERKGLGHPDTICDLLSERFSVALSRHYLERFGRVLHHNVDKALLSAGRSEPAFGGGRILKPIELYLSGRATAAVDGTRVPIAELAEEAVFSWLRENLHAFDPEVGLRLHCITEPGSPELVGLFMHQQDHGVVLANDTSIGVGYAPLSELERVVLAVERGLNDPGCKQRRPEAGEDIKVMGVRERDRITLTIACAFVGRHLTNVSAYSDAKARLAAAALDLAQPLTRGDVVVAVNTADNVETGDVYLTVSGTSAESGDDGETGRGNRGNGLITPFRPMTLEAMAGKNPITHVGKLYNAAAIRIAGALVHEVSGISAAECCLVSQIGAPIDRPRVANVRVRHAACRVPADTAEHIAAITEREIAAIPNLWQSFLSGTIPVA